jgi:hypothetical protein
VEAIAPIEVAFVRLLLVGVPFPGVFREYGFTADGAELRHVLELHPDGVEETLYCKISNVTTWRIIFRSSFSNFFCK